MEIKKRGRKIEERRRRRTIGDLSDDLMVEILHLLPLSSIIQCLDVCKRWQSLISNRGLVFLTNHINVAASPHDLDDHDDPRYMCLERGQREGMEISGLDFSINFPNKELYEHRLLSSCNGLLFYYYFIPGIGETGFLSECYISNPWTKECVRLPNPKMSCEYALYGLAFEDNSGNRKNVASYKIVMAHWDGDICTRNAPCKDNYKFEIYSSDKKKWRLLRKPSKPHSCLRDVLHRDAVYCNQVLYWQCYLEDHALMFNLEKETSGYLDLPKDNHGAGTTTYNCRLTVCDGLLHYIQIGPIGSSRLILWKMSMMSGGGWLILHNVDLRGVVERYLDIFPGRNNFFKKFVPIDMSCQGDDRVLFADHNRIVSYDLKRDVIDVVLWRAARVMKWDFFRYTPSSKCLSGR